MDDITERKRVEATLQESEQKYRQLFSTITDAIMLFDAETHRFVDVNEAALQLYGFTREEFLKLKHQDITMEPEMSEDSITQLLAGKLSRIPLRYHKKKDGTVFPVEISASAFVRQGRKLLCGVVRDITRHRQAKEELQKYRDRLVDLVEERTKKITEINEELQKEIQVRRQTEDDLRTSEEKFRTLLDFTYDWEGWMNPEGEYVYVSPACKRITGYDAVEFLKNPQLPVAITHTDDRSKLARHLHQDLHTDKVCHLDFRIITRHGEERWISHYCQPVYGSDGKHLGRRESNRDITERMHAKEALRQSEKRFRLALDATSDGVWDRNIRTGEIYYGENWSKLLGYTVDDVRQGRIRWENLLHPDDKPHALAAVNDHFAGRKSRYAVEFRVRNKAGAWQWILARGKVVEWDEQNNPLRFVGTHTDISARKRAEKALRRSSEKIELFAYSVAHDLKSPAIAIYGLTKLLHKNYQDILDDKGKKVCDQIMNSSEQLAALVEKINVYITAKETPLAIERVKLGEILQMIRDEFSVPLSIRQIKLTSPDCMPEIRADRLAILRVLRNLVDNSLKYGGDGLSRIEIGYNESETFHILSITDDGVGLKTEDTKKIFGVFKRKKTSRGIEGAGLGLAIVKEIAEQHQGEVWTEPGVKKGIVFFFSISKSL